ncbi:MAG: hypothetical protein EA408_12490 [Marinilabiliales bacterium]|nr:MAG: hypothetical protein EA408_12490 [Marinilabiliales bacterium]
MNVLITDTGSVFGHALALEYLNTGAHVYGISKMSNDQLNRYVNYNHLKHDVGGTYRDVRDLFFSCELNK